MPAPTEPKFPFGARLREIRKARGITQVELAQVIGSTQRAITYYEVEAEYPPAAMIPVLARALKVSTDELLGVKPFKDKTGRERTDDRLWKRFQQVRDLPERDQRAILRVVSTMIVATRNGNGRQPARRSRVAVGG